MILRKMELAHLYGIETQYSDFWGKKKQASKDELLKVANALGMEIWVQKKDIFDKMHTI